MPVSSIANLHPVATLVMDLKPRRVLDIGVGFGLYGALCRQILDIADGRYERAEWQAQIRGIENYADYRNPLWDYCYDSVVIGDARRLLPQLGRVELVLCCDVIEHFSKSDGLALIEQFLSQSECAIVSTPLVFMSDENSYTRRNPCEQHLSHWEPRDFRPWVREERFTSMTGIYLLSAGKRSGRIGYTSTDSYELRRVIRNCLPQAAVRAVRAARRALGKQRSAP